MKPCSQCGEGEGVIHLTEIKEGEVRTVSLCAKCAAEKGIQTAASLADTPLGGFLAALGEQGPSVPPAAGQETTCPGCGASLKDFRETGRLGCSECYSTFEEPLRELLRRLHGSTHHTGKAYLAPGAPPPTGMETDTLKQLRDELRRAIESEEFELAAKLRDRLKEHE